MYDYPEKPKRKQGRPYSRRFTLLFGFVFGLFVAAIAVLGFVYITIQTTAVRPVVPMPAFGSSPTPLPYNYGMSPVQLTATELAIRSMLTPQPIGLLVTPSPPNCYWMRSTIPDPSREQQLRILLDEAGYRNATITVRIEGETYECDDARSPSQPFHTMISIPEITVPLDDVNLFTNRQYLGNIVAELMAYVTATNPRPPLAAVITFTYGNQQRTWNASLPDAQNALAAGESGAVLWIAGFMGL